MARTVCVLILLGIFKLGGAIGTDQVEIFTNDIFTQQTRGIGIEFIDYLRASNTSALLSPAIMEDRACLNALTELFKGIAARKLWAWRFPDAWGFPFGLLYGNKRVLGNYDECIKINPKNINIKGQYCISTLPLGQLAGVDVNPDIRDHIAIDMGICVPAACTAKHVDIFMKNFYKQILKLPIDDTMTLVKGDTCKTNQGAPLDTFAICTIVILAILTTLVVLSTLLDYFGKQVDGHHSSRWVQAFSMRTNARQLFRIVNSKKNPNTIDALHGMRCLSLIWVVYGHTSSMCLEAPLTNAVYLLKWTESAASMFIQHGALSVDTFFFISGLLLAMIALRGMDKNSGKLNVPLMYLHRYMRLTPLVIIAILVYAALLPWLGSGPLWGAVKFDNYDICKRSWWETLLYIQNYSQERIMCMSHTWYLAVDMQLYILSPIMLIALWRWWRWGLGAITTLLILTSTCLFTIIMTTNLTLQPTKGAGVEAQYRLYYGTHVHAAPWLIGLLFGYYLYANKGKKYNIPQLLLWLGWILALALMFTCLFAVYPKSNIFGESMTKLEEASYVTLSRIAWPLGLCWVVFVCVQDRGGLANSFLSSELWQPLSKLSYGVYIWHPLILTINFGSIRTNTYFSNYNLMLEFWPIFGFSLLLAVVTYLVVEGPCASIESILLPARNSRTKDVPNEPVMPSKPESLISEEINAVVVQNE